MNPKILDYTLVSSKTQAGLVEKVINYMSGRWVPFHAPGAAAFGMSPVGGNNYFQAMVKYEITKEELEQRELDRQRVLKEEAEEAANPEVFRMVCDTPGCDAEILEATYIRNVGLCGRCIKK